MPIASFDLSDPRLVPARPEIADARLRGHVEADRYVAGEPRGVVVPSGALTADAALRCRPGDGGGAGRHRDVLRRGRRLRLRPVPPRRLCRLPAGGGPRPPHRRDPPGHGPAQLPLSRSGPEAAGGRPPDARRPPPRGGDGRRLSPAGDRRLRLRRPLRAARQARAGLRRHGRAPRRHALPLGRAHQPRPRLLPDSSSSASRRPGSRRPATPTSRNAGWETRCPSTSTVCDAATSCSGAAMSD